MRIDRAFVVLPVLGGDVVLLEPCLEHLVAAADEASAAGIPTTLVLASTLAAGEIDPVVASWAPLVRLLEGVDLLLVRVDAAGDRDQACLAGTREASARTVDPTSTLLLATVPQVAVGAGWITEHARHHAGGAEATTGPVRGAAAAHPTASNLAVRMEALRRNDLRPSADVTAWTLVHAVTPVVATLRVILRALP